MDDVDAFTWLQFTSAALEAMELPLGKYPIRTSRMEESIQRGGNLSVPDLMRGLMDWMDVTDDPVSTSHSLRQILDRYFPDNGETAPSFTFENEHGGKFRFGLGIVDQAQPLVAWQRRQWVVAIGCPRKIEPGRMTLAAPGPITLRVAQSIIGHAALIDIGGPIDSYETARASSRRTGSFYNWESTAATIVDWEFGYAITDRDGVLEPNDAMVALPPAHEWLCPHQLATLIAIGNGYL
ncbi:hypothetical protein [Aquisediminimonas sediminicola]|uniref:hypothetical protein n=1 Tax=Alteraquisediminimonas sediminicola TaxID=2676787 RepID=UPI001C8E8F83|nr:hypothetical protein [Aquisediminimonas sediminicola]